jgi:predicted nucleic acid-binding Zn ribbon protein
MNVKCRLCGKPYKLVGKVTDAMVCEACYAKIVKEHLTRVSAGVRVTVHYEEVQEYDECKEKREFESEH